ncbi:HEPN domain-containing protein [soil metagenome]
MTGDHLAAAYLAKARARRRVLEVLTDERAWSDVVREAQELVELALKAALRVVGIDPPKWHDVGPILVESARAFPEPFASAIPRLAEISRWLRRERELAFYGDVDLVPTESYHEGDAARAMADAFEVYAAIEALMTDREAPQGTEDESPLSDRSP